MKELDIGNSDFKSLIENNNYFVDKSFLIKEVIKSQKQVLLFPRPRRFGKTLNLSMLKYFFDINQKNEPNLFTELDIWNDTEEIKQKYAKYPIIFLSFKDTKEETWDKCYELIKEEIAELHTNYSFLVEGDFLAENEKQEFINIMFKTASQSTFEISLKKLCKYLYKYYNQKVVLLIDEYDTPLHAGYKNFYENAVSFMRNLLSGAFKDNNFLYKGVITGILRVSKESIFSGLNNISVYSVLDDKFSDCFGFTENETKKILKDFKVTTAYQDIKKWYDGYKFGNTTDIYNPWSILNYAIEFKSGFKPFWVNTSADKLLREQLKDPKEDSIREQLYQLINNKTIEKSINENFIFPDLDYDSELIWSLLVYSGYLTIVNKLDINEYSLKIPNYEISIVFKNIIIDWLKFEVKIKQFLLIETTKYLVNNQIADFEKGFKEIIGDTFSYFDTGVEPEKVYQSYILGLLAIIGDDYIIKSNRESGEGRYDILLIPNDKKKYGIVIEIKQLKRIRAEKKENLIKRINIKIQEAKIQIDENKYFKELIDNKVDNIIKLPIIFAGKEPYITLIDK